MRGWQPVRFILYSGYPRRAGTRHDLGQLTVFQREEDIIGAYVVAEGKAPGTYGLRYVKGQL